MQVTKLLIMQSSPAPATSSLLHPNVLLSNFFSHMLILCYPLGVRDKVSQTYKTTRKITVLYIFISECRWYPGWPGQWLSWVLPWFNSVSQRDARPWM